MSKAKKEKPIAEETIVEEVIEEGCNTPQMELEEKTKQCDMYLDQLQRAAAEFDNFKKRTIREKEMRYQDAVADTIVEFLPVLDTCERALAIQVETAGEQKILEGVSMIAAQITDVFQKNGIAEISALGEPFDPELHNAVMHIEDEAEAENIVIEVFQKGYSFKDRVIRHSMVKVAN